MKMSWLIKLRLAAIGLVGLLVIAGCSSETSHPANSTPDGSVGAGGAPAPAPTEDENGVIHFTHEQAGVLQPGQRTFNSPEEAAAAFREAVANKDRDTLYGIFGDEGKALIFSGDRVQEDKTLQAATDRINAYMQIERPSDAKAIICEGKQNWPFPIPIVKSDQGWFFDVVAGRDELLNRRIGEDELTAIQVCREYVEAQKEYARKPRTGDNVIQYAQHIMSHPGQKDGLFWEAGPGEELSPMGPLVAEARLEGYPATQPTEHKPHPYHGYIFHILKAQGADAPGGAMSYIVDGKMTKGFALVASPSAYGASGIMTFIVGQDGKVFQKNLGNDTHETVRAMKEYDPDKSWEEVKQ